MDAAFSSDATIGSAERVAECRRYISETSGALSNDVRLATANESLSAVSDVAGSAAARSCDDVALELCRTAEPSDCPDVVAVLFCGWRLDVCKWSRKVCHSAFRRILSASEDVVREVIDGVAVGEDTMSEFRESLCVWRSVSADGYSGLKEALNLLQRRANTTGGRHILYDLKVALGDAQRETTHASTLVHAFHQRLREVVANKRLQLTSFTVLDRVVGARWSDLPHGGFKPIDFSDEWFRAATLDDPSRPEAYAHLSSLIETFQGHVCGHDADLAGFDVAYFRLRACANADSFASFRNEVKSVLKLLPRQADASYEGLQGALALLLYRLLESARAVRDLSDGSVRFIGPLSPIESAEELSAPAIVLERIGAWAKRDVPETPTTGLGARAEVAGTSASLILHRTAIMQLVLCDGVARQTRDLLTTEASAIVDAPPALAGGRGAVRIVKRPAPKVIDHEAIMHATVLYTAWPVVDMLTFFAKAVFAVESSGDAVPCDYAHSALSILLAAVWTPATAAVSYHTARQPGSVSSLAAALASMQAALLEARSVLLQLRGVLAAKLLKEALADDDVMAFVMPEDCDLYGLRPLFHFDASPRRPPHRHDPAYHDRRFPRDVELLSIRRRRLNIEIGRAVA